MSDPIDPVGAVAERRRSARRRADPPPPPQVEGERANLPVAAGDSRATEPKPGDAREGPAIFAAQLLGQDGQKRGLRGGAPVLNTARATYLGNEYSGRADRRPRNGTVAKTEI